MHDLVIIGAGLAGSCLATVLSRQGWDVVLLERRQLPQHKVCGEFLSPESQISLQALGLYDTVANLSPVPMDHGQLTTASGINMRVELPGHAWGLSRFVLDQVLLETAAQAGADTRTGATVGDVTTSDAGCTVEVRTQEGRYTLQARTAIAACGRHPPVGLRTASDRTDLDDYQSHVGIKCHYEGVTMPQRVEIYLFPGGYAGVAPVEGGRVNLCLLSTRASFRSVGASHDAMLEAICQWNPALGQRLAAGTKVPDTQVAVAPVDVRRLPVPWDRIARVGDAVTMIPPLCGDGMAMAIRSAEMCAPLTHAFLSGQCSLEEWQQRYTQMWHQELDRPLRFGRWFQTLLSQPKRSNVLLSLGNLLPFLATKAVHATRVPQHSHDLSAGTMS